MSTTPEPSPEQLAIAFAQAMSAKPEDLDDLIARGEV